MERAFPWRGLSRGEGFPVGRAFPWGGLSRGEGFPVGRAFPWRGLSRGEGFPVYRAEGLGTIEASLYVVVASLSGPIIISYIHYSFSAVGIDVAAHADLRQGIVLSETLVSRHE